MRILRLAIVLSILPVQGFADVPVTNIPRGQWMLSRIVSPSRNEFSTAALEQRHNGDITAKNVACYYPPMEGGVYLSEWAICRVVDYVSGVWNSDTMLLPDLDARLGDIPTNTKDSINFELDSRLKAYSFNQRGEVKQVPDFSTAISRQTANTTGRDIVRELYAYLGHSERVDVVQPFESHNTEYTDDFSTDPASSWTTEFGSSHYVWDSTDDEMDVNNSTEVMVRYTANNPGSIEHEAQITQFAVTNNNRCAWTGVRMRDSSTTDDGYVGWIDTGNTFNITRYNAGVRTGLATPVFETWTASDYYTLRLAASGTAGSQVVLSYWVDDHNASKPSDPGWIGVDASPEGTYTDTSASGGGSGQRLDTSNHTHCGIAGRGRDADADTHHDYFKERAISDRGGAAAAPLKRRRIITAN